MLNKERLLIAYSSPLVNWSGFGKMFVPLDGQLGEFRVWGTERNLDLISSEKQRG